MSHWYGCPLLQSVRLSFEPLSNAGADSLTASTFPNLPTFPDTKPQNSRQRNEIQKEEEEKIKNKKKHIYNPTRKHTRPTPPMMRPRRSFTSCLPQCFASSAPVEPMRTKKILAPRISSHEDANRREKKKKNHPTREKWS
ncbi:hypothetical protein LZ31DRAFT_376274 [Colletotrichum somersetense]|nr:hypothetical protein LZ31DRAFT_376274 [Colletotrichum somersetense]